MRNYVLVAYDIAQPKRLRKIYKTMRGYGDGFQHSVFLCQLSEKEEAIMISKLNELIKPSLDQIVIIHLGKTENNNIATPNEWTVLGRNLDFKDNSIMIF